MKEYITSQIIDKKGYITGHEYHGELIRCKDCKWFTPILIHRGMCGINNGLNSPSRDDYCSRAVSK